MTKFSGEYPANWKQIANATKDEAGWRCVRCGHLHDPATGHTLTVHHLDNNKSNVNWYNLAALCQKCHLQIQGKVVMARPWLYEHSAWFKPYVAGYYAHKYLGLDLRREQVMADLEFYATLEREALYGRA